jgi:hypothetical protein
MATAINNPVSNQPLAQFTTPLVNPQTGVITTAQMPFFTNVQNLLAQGPFLPVIIPSGSNNAGDYAPALQAAYRQAAAAGGGTIFVPAGTYNIASPVMFTATAPIALIGAGRATKFLRAGTMPAGVGMFDATGATDLTFCNFLVDGSVMTPTGVTYTQINAIGGDPRNALLSTNTSFWLHDGCARVSFSDITIQHTGGYAVLADANNADITDLNFYRLQLENNRPFLFGNSAADCNYGSWPGGVLAHGNGLTSTAMVRRCNFLSCSAKRCTGNAFWQHLYGFSSTHSDFTFTDMYGEDIGRDFIQPGGVTGMTITSIRGRRIGYITRDDTSPATPAYLTDQWAVALDCGVCFNTVMSGINLTSVLGGFCEIDGQLGTVLSDFIFRIPSPGDPDYEEDSIADWPGNLTYGVQMANAPYNPFSEGYHKVGNGTIINCPIGAVRIYASHNNKVDGLNIVHPSTATVPPIVIGNIGTANNQRSYGNTVSNNRISYSPPAAAACVVEDQSIAPFNASDVNECLGNQVMDPTGKATEFSKASSSASVGSVTGVVPATGTLNFTAGFLTGT